MSSPQLSIFDTTLRDGAQAEAVSFSINDKLKIVRVLDSLGIHYVEAGNPYSNPKDALVFERIAISPPKRSKPVAFSSTCRKHTPADEDEALLCLVRSLTPAVCIFGKASSFHATRVLETTLEENLRMIADSVAYLKSQDKEVIFDAEHFFDGFKSDPDYALGTLSAALDSGADIVALCDTNGGAFPSEIKEAVKEVAVSFPKAVIGIHCHNDCGMAVANTIMAVEAGALHIQGTFLGIGERCGNASLSTVIPNLQLKRGIKCLSDASMRSITSAALQISEISNLSLRRYTPYVGKSAFAHKAGMHVSGVLKDTGAFEHIDPALVGNERRILISEISGRSTLISKIKPFVPELDESSPELKNLLADLKSREAFGYQYEAAQASFELYVHKFLGTYRQFYRLINFKIINEQPAIPGTSAMAMVKIGVDDNHEVACAEGMGPVNAMDKALRQALSTFYPCIAGVRLTDFKVRVIETNTGTDAKVRVMIESTDGRESWTTTGVSVDVIEASFQALNDSIEYKLMRELK